MGKAFARSKQVLNFLSEHSIKGEVRHKLKHVEFGTTVTVHLCYIDQVRTGTSKGPENPIRSTPGNYWQKTCFRNTPDNAPCVCFVQETGSVHCQLCEQDTSEEEEVGVCDLCAGPVHLTCPQMRDKDKEDAQQVFAMHSQQAPVRTSLVELAQEGQQKFEAAMLQRLEDMVSNPLLCGPCQKRLRRPLSVKPPEYEDPSMPHLLHSLVVSLLRFPSSPLMMLLSGAKMKELEADVASGKLSWDDIKIAIRGLHDAQDITLDELLECSREAAQALHDRGICLTGDIDMRCALIVFKA